MTNTWETGVLCPQHSWLWPLGKVICNMENYWYVFKREIHLHNLTSKMFLSLWKQTHCGHFIISDLQITSSKLNTGFPFIKRTETIAFKPHLTFLLKVSSFKKKKEHSQGWHANQSCNTLSNAVWTAFENNKWLCYPNYQQSGAPKNRQAEKKGPPCVKQFLISHHARQSSGSNLPTFSCRPCKEQHTDHLAQEATAV